MPVGGDSRLCDPRPDWAAATPPGFASLPLETFVIRLVLLYLGLDVI
jgi:hypothetical protein